MTKTLKIKEQATLIKEINHKIVENQKFTLPPTLDSVEEAFGMGVLIALVSCRDLMYGIPFDGAMKKAIVDEDLTEFVKELGLEEQFNNLI